MENGDVITANLSRACKVQYQIELKFARDKELGGSHLLILATPSILQEAFQNVII